MRGVQATGNGRMTNGLAEPSHRIRDEQKEVRNDDVTNGHGLSEEHGSSTNQDMEDPKCGLKELVWPQAIHQRPQQQHQGPQSVVCWERFLPVRILKVLLVEYDDSTRHVVSALLRNCSYEVTAVANGLEAWRILEDSTNHIDLVLTEVVVPFLSGIGLLGKIMSHKTYMNIPVIMMSSNDSMGIVFKCLSKGAVDFLVKPIRKNELKNLWQHVWRKCHSSSGSGSESGIQGKKSSKSKSVEGSDHNSGSNDEDDNISIGLNGRDGNGSDNGSGTQSSWTKRAVDVDSPQPISPWDQFEDPPDSTCAQVIYSGHNWVPTATVKECHGKDGEPDNLAMGKDLEIGVPRNPDLQLEERSKKVLMTLAGAKKDKINKVESTRDGDKLEKDKKELNSGTPNGELTKEIADLNEAIIHCTNPHMESVAIEAPNDVSKKNIKDKAIYDTEEISSLELSLKRLRDVGDIGNNARERNALKHSAFSRYTTVTANQTPGGNVGSCSPVDNSSEAAKTESMQNLHSNSDATPNRRSHGSSNNNDMGSTTNNAFTKPAAFNDQPTSKSGVNTHPSSAFQPITNSHVQVQHHHHHYHHHHHHVHNMKQEQKQQPNHDDLSLRTMVKSDPQCGPSKVLHTPIEGNAANYSLNGSASGSKHGSNEQHGNSPGVINDGANMESDNGVAGKCGGGSGSGSRSGVDQSQFTPREAALNKFRQKRKDRCFEKKVRYHSRKKLAEQRPRVRGQFVRQVVSENESKDEDS